MLCVHRCQFETHILIRNFKKPSKFSILIFQIWSVSFASKFQSTEVWPMQMQNSRFFQCVSGVQNGHVLFFRELPMKPKGSVFWYLCHMSNYCPNSWHCRTHCQNTYEPTCSVLNVITKLFRNETKLETMKSWSKDSIIHESWVPKIGRSCPNGQLQQNQIREGWLSATPMTRHGQTKSDQWLAPLQVICAVPITNLHVFYE